MWILPYILLSTLPSLIIAQVSTWSYISHYYNKKKSTDHVIASFCHEFPSSPDRNIIDSTIDVQCGNQFYSTRSTTSKQVVVEATNNENGFLIQLHLPHKQWRMIWDHNRGHPADCVIYINGKSIFNNNRMIHRRPPSHKCWLHSTKSKNKMKEKKNSAEVPSFSLQRHISSEQMVHLIDFVYHVANTLVTYSNLTKNISNSSSSHKNRQRRHLLEEEEEEEGDEDVNNNKDISAESLLQMMNSIDIASKTNIGIQMRTAYEAMVEPITNALAEQMPHILFQLVKFPVSILMRDSIVESEKGMTTEPTLGQLDPNGPGAPPTLIEESSSTFAKGTNPGQAGAPMEGIGNTLGMQISDSVTVELSDALWKDLQIKLEDSISNTVTRQTVRSLNHVLTSTLSHTISRLIIELSSASLTRSIAKETNKILIPSLTQSISETITHSLTRNPKSDYYCFYCEKHNIYCNLCQKETIDNYNVDWNIAYYSKYYGNYFSWYYSNSFVDSATDEYLKVGKREV
jgi:hypothetical protein